MIAVTLIAFLNVLFVESPSDVPIVLALGVSFAFLTMYTWVKKSNLILEGDSITIEPVLKKYLPFLKSRKVNGTDIQRYSFKIAGPIWGALYNSGYQLIIRTQSKRNWVTLYSPVQDMTHFEEDLIACLGKEKHVEELPM